MGEETVYLPMQGSDTGCDTVSKDHTWPGTPSSALIGSASAPSTAGLRSGLPVPCARSANLLPFPLCRCRYVRERDRLGNEYPKLHYPELYVLKGGYKEFFLKCQVSWTLESMVHPLLGLDSWTCLMVMAVFCQVSGDLPGTRGALEPTDQICTDAESHSPGGRGAGLGVRQLYPDLTRSCPPVSL